MEDYLAIAYLLHLDGIQWIVDVQFWIVQCQLMRGAVELSLIAGVAAFGISYSAASHMDDHVDSIEATLNEAYWMLLFPS